MATLLLRKNIRNIKALNKKLDESNLESQKNSFYPAYKDMNKNVDLAIQLVVSAYEKNNIKSKNRIIKLNLENALKILLSAKKELEEHI